MKLLWLLVGIASAYTFYHFYYYTDIRKDDLTTVMQQNTAIHFGTQKLEQATQKQLDEMVDMVEKQGNSPKDLFYLNRPLSVQMIADSTLEKIDSVALLLDKELLFSNKQLDIDKEVDFSAATSKLLQKYAQDMAQNIIAKDTALNELKEHLYFVKNITENNLYFPFAQQKLLSFSYALNRFTLKSVNRLYWGSCGIIRFDRIIGMAAAKSMVVKAGSVYEADMFITVTEEDIRPEMEVSMGTVKVKRGVGEIRIPNMRATNFDNDGKSVQILSGTIKLKDENNREQSYSTQTQITIRKKL